MARPKPRLTISLTPSTGGAASAMERSRGPALRRRQRPAEVSRARSGRGRSHVRRLPRALPSTREPTLPNPIRSDTSRREIPPRGLAGDSSAARIPPHDPDPERAGAVGQPGVAHADTSGAEGRSARPSAKKSGHHEPEVPSVGEPDTAARDGAGASSSSSPSGTSPIGDRGFPQDVASLWKTHDAF